MKYFKYYLIFMIAIPLSIMMYKLSIYLLLNNYDKDWIVIVWVLFVPVTLIGISLNKKGVQND